MNVLEDIFMNRNTEGLKLVQSLWANKTKIILYKNKQRKLWRRKGTVQDQNHTNSSVKHGGGNIMTQSCMDTCGTGSLIFIDDVTAEAEEIEG